MLGALGLVALIWVGARIMGVPARVRWALLALAWGVVVLAQLVLPPEASIRQATGGDVRPWLVLGGLAVLVLVYRQGLRMLRARARPAPVATDPDSFSQVELSRYARQLMLREVGGTGQRRLKQASVLVVGAGGLGSPVILYLAASGVGRIHVVDDDVVELSNLQRQIIHADDRLGMAKVESAAIGALGINPHVKLVPHRERLDEAGARALVAEVDLVLDGTDNFDTRYMVNRVCVELGKPLVSAAMTQWEGQISVYDPASGGPCYECVFPVRPAAGVVPSCAEAGVIAPLPGVIGSLMAVEAIKVLTGAGEPLRGRLMMHDALEGLTRSIRVRPRPDCPVCGSRQH